jgi:sec-independent protein translocase protein TatC
MARQSKDLFDDTTMSFGEHLEVLRVHLFKALIGLVIAVIACLIYGESIVAFVRAPIDRALADFSREKRDAAVEVTDDVGDLERDEWWDQLTDWFSNLWGGTEEQTEEAATAETPEPSEDKPASTSIRVGVTAFDLLSALHEVVPESFAAPPESAREQIVNLTLTAVEFGQFNAVANQSLEPVTFNVQEAFMTYLKVSLIASIVFASPWIFFQIWQFVAAGLYQHERKFVYIYGAMSLVLFIAGAAFCFYAVFPVVLEFLLNFNANIGVTPQIRLSEWISFAVMLPLMFGISFQLPLVMRFLTAISIFDVATYRAKRRLAVLVIAFLSMVLTPADPFSMLLMMFPLVLLYEFGIVLCSMASSRNPFEGEAA